HTQDTILSEKKLVQHIIDASEKCAVITSEITTLSFGKDDYLLDRAYALIDIKRPMKALELIEDAERCMDSSRKRSFVFMDILRARCYINLKIQVYELAIIFM